MAGLSPRPTAGTSLLLPDGTELDGAVQLVDGIGVALRASGANGYATDAPFAAAARPDSLYIPDLSSFPASGVTFPTSGPSGTGSVSLTDLRAVILGTTPGAADASNCYRLVVSGSSAGTQALALIDDVRTHTFDGYRGQAYAGQGGGSYSFNEDSAYGQIVQFQVTADSTLTQIGLPFNESSAAAAGVRRKVYVLNADRTEVLAESAVKSDPLLGGSPGTTLESFAEANTTDVFTLTESLDLTEDTTYWIAWVLLDFDADARAGLPYSPSWFREGIATTPTEMLNLGSTDDGTGSAALAGAPTVDEGQFAGSFVLFGSVGAVLLTGDPVLTVDTLGTPPAAPTQVNVRMIYTEEQVAP